MFYRFTFFILILFLFSCQETKIPESLDGEIWSLKSQIIQITDTTYSKGTDGNSLPQITTTEFPISMNREETWTFENQELTISTKLSSGNVTNISFQVENTPEGFILKNKNEEDKVCKIKTRTSSKMILEAGGEIVLQRVK